jgi:hypothetical protein
MTAACSGRIVAQVANHPPWKSELLKEQLAGGGTTIAQIRTIATNLGVYQERYLARPVAEMLIAQGAEGADRMAATLATMPITGKDYKGDLLRAAFTSALQREGIPPDAERAARAFYERRQHAPPATAASRQPTQPTQQQSYPADPSNPPAQSLTGLVRSVLRNLGIR